MGDLKIAIRSDELVVDEHRVQHSHQGRPFDGDGASPPRPWQIALDQGRNRFGPRRRRQAAGEGPDPMAYRLAPGLAGYR